MLVCSFTLNETALLFLVHLEKEDNYEKGKYWRAGGA